MKDNDIVDEWVAEKLATIECQKAYLRELESEDIESAREPIARGLRIIRETIELNEKCTLGTIEVDEDDDEINVSVVCDDDDWLKIWDDVIDKAYGKIDDKTAKRIINILFIGAGESA